MAEVTLPFVNDGKPFKPKLYPEDLANYEEAEVVLVEQANAVAATNLDRAKARRAIMALQRDFVATVLAKSLTPPVDLQLTVPELRQAFTEIYVKGQAPAGSADRPLDNGGKSSAPSPSPASA